MELLTISTETVQLFRAYILTHTVLNVHLIPQTKIQQTTVLGPNLSCFLFLQMKFYTATLICLVMVYGCFQAIWRQSYIIAPKILWSPKNKYLLSGTLLEKNVLLLDIDIAFDTLISNRQTNKKLNRDLTFLSFFPTSFLSSFLFWSEIERPYLVKSSISFCFSD